MKKTRQFLKIISILCVLAFYSQAQITTTTSSGRNQTNSSEQVEAKVQRVIDDSERYFRQAMFHLEDNRPDEAWENFDKAIEVFLLSGIENESNQKLKDSYLKLIDKIYQKELFYKNKSTQIKNTNLEISPKCISQPLSNQPIMNFNEKELLFEAEDELLLEAVDLYKRKKYEDSLSIIRRVLSETPMNATAHWLLGKIYYQQANIDQSISSLKTALFWNNELIEAHLLLGRIYLEKSDLLQAQNYSVSALMLNSDNIRAQALSRLVKGRASNEDKKIIEDNSVEFEKLLQKSSSDIIFVAPFAGSNSDLLNTDFAYVLSEILVTPNLCAVNNEEREKLIENFGFNANETFTLATAIKFAIATKSNLLVVGQYTKTFDSIKTRTQIIRVNEGRFLSEGLLDGGRITRDIVTTDSLSNLRILQGQIAYQILYQNDKALPYTQNQLMDAASKIKIPASLNIDGKSASELDFSIDNSLKRTTCSKNVLENLQLRNFSLGTTFSEAAKILPKATIKNINSYEKQMFQKFSTTTLKDARFKDISSIQLQFFDNLLYSIEIVYDDNIKWKDLNEFSSQVEKSFNLPTMKKGSYEFDGNYLYCGNYQIKVMFAYYKIPAIHLFDTTIFDKIKQREKEEKIKVLQKKIEENKRKKEIEEEKKKVFKP